MEHRLVFLTPGQQAPDGSQGTTVSGGIVWIGDNFPTEATLGKILVSDPTPSTTYSHRPMTAGEIDIFNNPPEEGDIETLTQEVNTLKTEVDSLKTETSDLKTSVTTLESSTKL